MMHMGIMGVLKATSEEFMWENNYGGWATIIVLLLLLLLWQFNRLFLTPRPPSVPLLVSDSVSIASSSFNSRISELVTDADLKFLMGNLDQKPNESEKWEQVIDKRNSLLSYSAKWSKPKDGPLKYLSVTRFNNVSSEMLRDFYMDNVYRKQWDKILLEHEQLQVDESKGVEVGRTVKKFPLLRPREYVLAWRLWEGRDKAFYCFMRECEHPLASRHRKYVRVEYFRSGWRIKQVPGENAAEITMFHQEDAGLNTEMAKLCFSKGIWSYVCKMDNALRKYPVIIHQPSSPVATAVNLIQEVPSCLDSLDRSLSSTHPTLHAPVVSKSAERMMSKVPSRKLLANSFLILGGAVCLYRGHSSLGAKVALAYIITKLSKHGAKSNKSKEG